MDDPAVKTSRNSLLRVSEVAIDGGAGLIGITICPGKVDPHAMTGPTERDLDIDVRTIHDWGARAVLTLMEDAELALLHVTALGATVERYGMEWVHLPIRDLAIPDASFERAWKRAGPRLEGLLLEGERVLVHCRGGLGRSGMIAARMLVELGTPADEAIARVRSARPGAVETSEQVAYVRAVRP